MSLYVSHGKFFTLPVLGGQIVLKKKINDPSGDISPLLPSLPLIGRFSLVMYIQGELRQLTVLGSGRITATNSVRVRENNGN